MCFALFIWFARAALLAGIVKTATGKGCKECKTLGQLKLVCVQMLVHECNFPNSHFLDSVIRNTKGPQALKAKPATAFPEIVYITVILSCVSARNRSLNRLNL